MGFKLLVIVYKVFVILMLEFCVSNSAGIFMKQAQRSTRRKVGQTRSIFRKFTS